MELETPIATQPDESASGQTPDTQATEPATQVADQPQDPGTSKVDTNQQTPASKTEGRPKPSTFYGDRKEIQRLKSTVESMNQQIRQLVEMQTRSLTPPAPKVEPKKTTLLDDPVGWAQTIENQLQEIANMKKEILEKELPSYLEKRDTEKSYAQKQQEALELIYPKTDPNSKDTVNQRYESNPQLIEELVEIAKANPLLNEAWDKDPVQAAGLLMALHENQRLKAPQKRSPLVPSKAQMTTPASSSATNGNKRMPNLQELENQITKMNSDLQKNPRLVHDPEFKKKREAVNQELVKLATQGK